jgi:ubiquinone/menaquinone biosynthesis C-methylase UbiE
MSHIYDASVFDVTNVDAAKRIILTPENSTTQERWAAETPYLTDLITKHVAIDRNTVLLDYGCGIGRMAKALIDHARCKVVGADFSASMRTLAVPYVGSRRFSVCAPVDLTEHPASAMAAIAIWVLQHCERPDEDIARIHQAMKPGARLFVADSFERAIPAIEKQLFTSRPTLIRKWMTDGVNVRALLDRTFAFITEGSFDTRLPGILPGLRYWAVFEKAA